jgi:signal transduction histidine kinase
MVRIMDGAGKKTRVFAARSTLLGIAQPVLARRLAGELEQYANTAPIVIAPNLLQLRELSARTTPTAILLDQRLLLRAPLAEALSQFTATAPVILLAPLECQAEVAPLIAAGNVEFVAQEGDFIPLAASLIRRRLRWAAMSESVLGPPWAKLPGNIGEIFRHEVNNPLTGILGNAELLLGHPERLTPVDTQRLQTVVDLAVRLRETIRRLSNEWESHSHRPNPA